MRAIGGRQLQAQHNLSSHQQLHGAILPEQARGNEREADRRCARCQRGSRLDVTTMLSRL